MIKIHIARQHQMLGQFSPEEVAEGLKSGQFLPTDLAWHEPMDLWKPLEEFDNLPKPVGEVVVPPLPQVEELIGDIDEAGPAWERRARLGMFPALIETIRQIYSAPQATFRGLDPKGGYAAPFWFYLILCTVSYWFATICQMFMGVNPEKMLTTPEISHSMWVASRIMGLIIIPFLIAGVAFVGTAFFHGLLETLGGGKNGFQASFRAFCYAFGAAAIMMFIPMCGVLIALSVAFVFLCIALAAVHRTEPFRAVGGVLLGFLIACGLMYGFYALLISAMGISFK